MIDLHVHTSHSADSEASMEEYCRKAIDSGIRIICFTDHIDCNKADWGYGYYSADKFFNEFAEIREKYSDKLLILSGIEFAEPHLYKKELDKYSSLPYDFILGSIHYWIDDMSPELIIDKGLPIEFVFERYWEEVYNAVSFGGFDSLAHLDFPKRYLKKSVWSENFIKDIFCEMIKNDIALEINTSSLRRGLNEAMPDRDLLMIYKKTGGSKITIGADTHNADDLSSGYDYARSLVDGNMKSIVYIRRKAFYEDLVSN